MTQLLSIQEDKISINKLAVNFIEGTVHHVGQLNLTGPMHLKTDLTVVGTIEADTLRVKNLITEAAETSNTGQWISGTEEELQGKGLNWSWSHGSVQFGYRNGNRLWSNANIDLDASKSYNIDNTLILSLSELGRTVTKSNLREVGKLKNLQVLGNAEIANFAFFNATDNRVGINTQSPNSTLSIVDKDLEIIIGSQNHGTASIGTYTNSNLSLITDNVPRVTLKTNGDVIFGNESAKNANVIIHGTLTVENIVSDTRIDRFSSLDFKATRDNSIYGQGLQWSGTGSTRQFMMRADPDRLWSSENIDLKEGNAYYIAGFPILSSDTLGSSVVNSNLTKIGILSDLTVNGLTKLTEVDADSINLQGLILTSSKINAKGNLLLEVSNDEVFYADIHEISLGNNNNTRRTVKIHGPLSVGINNPDPSVSFSVNGDVSFNNKKFINGETAPQAGRFNKGDICWNNDPKDGNYVGWICTMSGEPGVWRPFGAIS